MNATEVLPGTMLVACKPCKQFAVLAGPREAAWLIAKQGGAAPLVAIEKLADVVSWCVQHSGHELAIVQSDGQGLIEMEAVRK